MSLPLPIDIRLEGPGALEAYATVPIGFRVQSRLDLNVLCDPTGSRFVEIPVEPWWKDYDRCVEDRPPTLARRFDFTNWGIFSAFAEDVRVGGIIAARDCPGCEMLDGREDLIALFDLRVHPDYQGRGIGRALFERAIAWGREHGCAQLSVETQDNNVAACRFYSKMGCRLYEIREHAYPEVPDEAMLLWRRGL